MPSEWSLKEPKAFYQRFSNDYIVDEQLMISLYR